MMAFEMNDEGSHRIVKDGIPHPEYGWAPYASISMYRDGDQTYIAVSDYFSNDWAEAGKVYLLKEV